MFIISLYHIDLLPLPHNPQSYLYGQSQINQIKGLRTVVLGGRLPKWFEPLLPDALPCRTAQISRFFKQGHRFADRNVACVRQLLGKTFFEVVRKAIEQDRQSVSKAREAWQKATGKEASDLTFKRFLSALAQDISE